MLRAMTTEIPSDAPHGVAYLDLETRKVPTPVGFRMDSGEVLRTRWQIFAAGVAIGNQLFLVWGDEDELLKALGELLEGVSEVRYFATREFDEMIARGRFTNARRAHQKAPTFPAVPGAEELLWTNVRRPGERFPERPGSQIASKDVPAAWKAGRREEVLGHLAWDVRTLVELDSNRL